MKAKKFWSVLLSLCMALGFLSVTAVTASAAGGISWTRRSSVTTYDLTKAAYGRDMFIAVGESGTIIMSADGITWSIQTSTTTKDLYDVTYTNNIFVIVGESGTILTSVDGTNWSVQASPTTNGLWGVTYGNGKFVAVGTDGTIITSVNGTDWFVQPSPITSSLTYAAYGNNLFVAVGNKGKILTSADGTNWSAQSSPTAEYLWGVAYGENVFVAVGNYGTVLTSADGTNWIINSSISSTGNFCGITYGNNMFVAVRSDGMIYTSTDGTNWSAQAVDTGRHYFYGAAYGNNMFVAVGYHGMIFTSEIYSVTHTLAGLTTNGVPYVWQDNDYTATLTADTGCLLPAGISVTVGGSAETLAASAAEADTAGECYYDPATGAVKVAKVNGTVVITAAGIAKTYTITAVPSSIVFSSSTEGYATAPAAQTVTVTNTGNSAVSGYTVTGGGADFSVTYTSAAIAAGDTSTFTVQPIAGLSVGTHTATLTVQTTEGSKATVDLSFTVTDATLPTVSSVTPNGTDASISGDIEITFSEAMDPAAGTITLNGGAALTGGSWSVNAKVYAIPYTTLAYSTEYTVAISGFKDTAGNTMTDDSTHSFTTEARSSSGNSSGSNVSYYTITATAGAGGSISPSGSASVKQGGAKTYTITAKNSYEIKEVLVDGVSIGAVSTYTFESVKKAHTITASFQKVGKETETVNPFSDVKPGDWFYDNVLYVYGKGLMNGTAAGAFDPSGTMTRGMIVAVLYRMSGDTGSYPTPFGDITSGAYYENAAAWAYAGGIVSGVGSGQFAPDSAVSREQLAVMLYNYAKYQGYDVSIGEDTNILSYNDALSISDYAYAALQWACGAEILNGDTNGNLNPQSSATRAEVAAMLQRFMQKVAATN